MVKADQLDESSIWQELDEFVVTRELTGHITDLVALLLSTMESETEAVSKNGIWVSGFFGCGKSHFIKVLSYLLDNEEHEHNGERRRAVDFFEDKLDDPLLYADLKKVVAAPTDTILFNVDSKADHADGRDALLRVFLKVLNEKQGYSGDHPHIAHMERYLDQEGQAPSLSRCVRESVGRFLARRTRRLELPPRRSDRRPSRGHRPKRGVRRRVGRQRRGELQPKRRELREVGQADTWTSRVPTTA